MDTVVVTGRQEQSSLVTLLKVRIERRLATDVGQLMSLFTGIQTKSYGGLGGMKTVTFRSLGSGHISTVYDGFTLSQTQSGQTDLGQLPVDFVTRVDLVGFDPLSMNYPVHAKLAGQIISVETRHLEHRDKFNLNVGSQAGSFGQLDAHAFAARQLGKWRIAASGKARRFNGAYPFSYQNGFSEVNTRRSNGDLRDVFGTGSVTFTPKTGQRFHLTYNGAAYNKGLPGAVVFYNEHTVQRLSGNNHAIALRHNGYSGHWATASTATFQQSDLHYVDSNYLNAQGYLHSAFRAQEGMANQQVRYSTAGDSLQVLVGTGVRYERLVTEQYTTTPQRFSADFLAALQWNWRVTLKAQLGLQQVADVRPQSSRSVTAFQPAVELLWKRRKFGAIPGYRYTVRQPSFNELYYNQVGNDDLLPERAHLAYVQMSWEKTFPTSNYMQYSGKIQPFYVHASDKILAVPTKNLFIWSIQNIGQSDAWGVEAQQTVQRHFGPFNLTLRLQYTFQYTIDLSDPQSDTYRSLLSYSPLHAGTSELDLRYKRFDLSILTTYQGERYALNQNIPANLLDDFWLLDASLSYRFYWNDHDLNVRFAVNNITNNYYNYIRYFIMPGRNIALRLSYDF